MDGAHLYHVIFLAFYMAVHKNRRLGDDEVRQMIEMSDKDKERGEIYPSYILLYSNIDLRTKISLYLKMLQGILTALNVDS